MQKKSGTYLVWIATLSMVAGCTMTPQQTRYTAVGAAGGALVGGGIGCGIAASIDRDDPTSYAIGCPIGVGVGALAGGLIGYYMTPTAPPPRPAPPPNPPPLPPPPPPAPVKEKMVLRGVHFDFNKSDIRADSEPILEEAAETLRSRPNLRVDVNGYCDAIGGDEYNLKLSYRRAAAVVKYLANKGIAADRMTPHGFGKTDFVATNDTDEGRAENRRVELVPEGQ